MRVLVDLLLQLMLIPELVIGTTWTYSRARRMGYRPPAASLITVTGWIVGALGVVIGERYAHQPADPLIFDLWIFNLSSVCAFAFLLSMLPRKNSRVFGPRRVQISWSSVMLLLASACLLFPALLFFVGGVDFPWLLATLIGSVPIALFFVFMAWVFKRFEDAMESPMTIEKCLTENPKAPVLYLRPFQTDYLTFADRLSFELYFREVLTEFLGPVVALGNPQDYFQMNPLHTFAARLYATDSNWLEKLEELAQKSVCIVVEMTRSDNLRTEFECVRRKGFQTKLFVFSRHPERDPFLGFFEKLRFGATHANWQRFSHDLAILGYHLPGSDPGPGSVMTFDEAGQGVVLTTRARNATDYVKPIAAWLRSSR